MATNPPTDATVEVAIVCRSRDSTWQRTMTLEEFANLFVCTTMLGDTPLRVASPPNGNGGPK